MRVVTVERLQEAGFDNPNAVFEEIAIVGGFGAVKASPGRTLDTGGIGNKDAKAAVDKILAGGKKAVKDDATK